MLSSWSVPSAPLFLESDEVNVYKFVPGELVPLTSFFMRLLTPDEEHRLERLAIEEARYEFIICRGMLHVLLSALCEETPRNIRLREESFGKPYLEEGAHDHPLRFNLTHTDGLCLIACARSMEVGVDAEWVKPLPELDVMARKYLGKREIAQWEIRDPVQKTELFYEYWSAKESLLKASGSGLRIPPDQIDTLDVMEGKPVEGRQEDGLYFRMDAAVLYPLPLQQHYKGWLAVLGRAQRISLIEIDLNWLRNYMRSIGRNVEK